MSALITNLITKVLPLAANAQNQSTKFLDMAATPPNQSPIDKVAKSEVPVPWCHEFNNM
jgi:hypothetical protein